MGFKTFGFAGGRPDTWEPDQDVYWGAEKTWLGGDVRYAHGDEGIVKDGPAVLPTDDDADGDTHTRDLENPLAAVQMGLIYVNPEGPDGNPDPLKAAIDIRETFARMAMNDEETVASLPAGTPSARRMARARRTTSVLTWRPRPSSSRASAGRTNSARVKARTRSPAASRSPGRRRPRREPLLLREPFQIRMGAYEEPAGAHQWVAKNAEPVIPDPADPTNPAKRRLPTMLTTDLSLRFDRPTKKFRAVFSSTRGVCECLRPRVVQAHASRHGPALTLPRTRSPREELIWQDPIPTVNHPLVDAADIAALKQKIAASGLTVAQLVSTAWASASTFRGSDKRGGANGARIRLAPQKDWPVNNPAELVSILAKLEAIQGEFNASSAAGKKISLADLIVLAGGVGIEQAAKAAGHEDRGAIHAWSHGRHAGADRRRILRRARAIADGFRNYSRANTPCPPRRCSSTRRSSSRSPHRK